MSEKLLSDKNPLLKEVRRAANKGPLTSGPGLEGFALAEGPHLLEEALRSKLTIHTIIQSESARMTRDLPWARQVLVSDAIFAGLTSTESPQGVLALVKPPTWTFADLLKGTALLVVLDGIQDSGNAGAILRAAEAFGATGAVFLKGSVHPYNPKCLRASAGSIFRLPLLAGLSIDEFVGQCKLPLYATDARATKTLAATNLGEACALIIGSEGRGISQALAARATGLRIPTTQVESLNAAVAAAVVLYEAQRQRSPLDQRT